MKYPHFKKFRSAGLRPSLAAAAVLISTGGSAMADFSFGSFAGSTSALYLGGDAAVVSGAARLTPMLTNAAGELWHQEKQLVGQGFESTFSIKLHRPDDDYFYGTDGITFIVQNTPDGIFTIPDLIANGLKTNALNIKFDSWFNGTTDVSSSSVQVRSGTTILKTVDLSKIAGITLDTPPVEGPPGGGPPQGFPIPTLTSRSSFPASEVRVAYRPGLLDVYFQGVKVIDALVVDLPGSGAIDGEGKAFVGFSATTSAYKNVKGENNPRIFADQSQFSDVLSWSFSSGAPAEQVPLALISHAFDQENSTLTLSWQSAAGKSYRIQKSEDLVNWTAVQGAESISSQGSSTTSTVSFTPSERGFFRVQEN